MTTNNNCAAVVVLYHPGPEVLQNILSWSGQVARIYAIDNSEPAATAFADDLCVIENLVYLPQHENTGVAKALNTGVGLAMADGYEWLLTMDQDSVASPAHVAGLLAVVPEGGEGTVALVAPFALLASNAAERGVGTCDVCSVITSGSLLNVSIYQSIGPFIDDLFIDGVDDEYCLRAKSLHYRVLQNHDVVLEHKLGDIKEYDYRGRKVFNSNHSWMRRYYITRNRLFIVNRYSMIFPEICSGMLDKFKGEIKGILLFETDKLKKIRMMVKGWLDYHRGRMGRLRV